MDADTEVTLVPTEIRHVKEISDNLRDEDKAEALRIGVEPRKGCFYAYRSALWKRTALIDGQAAAMWGVAGNPLGLIGQPYLITTDRVRKVSPLRFSRIYRDEVSVMSRLFPILENYVDAEYKGAVRMLKIAGFELLGPETVKPSSALFYKFRKVS